MATLAKKLAVAVDLGATNLRVALVSSKGKILKKARGKTARTGKDGIVVTNQIIRLIHEITKEINLRQVAGIGVASIGPLDYAKGGVINAPNSPFEFIPLTKPLKQTFLLPLCLYTDTKAAVLAEKYYGAGKTTENLVYITISTGIGGGAIVDGHLLFGKMGNAAEIGHVVVETRYSFPCGCKNGVGHWEGCASGRNIPPFFKFWAQQIKKQTAFEVQEAKDIFDQARRKNKIAIEFLDELAKINARAISDIIVAYDPELITIGGSVALSNQEFIIKGINKYVDHYLKVPKIQITKLGEDIGLLGAAAAVFQK